MSEKENDYGLDGSAKDFSTYIDGDKLDPQSALLLERELQNDEQNLPARLKLLFITVKSTSIMSKRGFQSCFGW